MEPKYFSGYVILRKAYASVKHGDTWSFPTTKGIGRKEIFTVLLGDLKWFC